MEIFTPIFMEKGCRNKSVGFLFYTPKIGCISQKNTYDLPLKKLDLDCASISNRAQRRDIMLMMGLELVTPWL